MINIYITHLIEVGCPTQQVIKTKKWKLEYMSIAYRDWKCPDPQNAWQSIYTQQAHIHVKSAKSEGRECETGDVETLSW